jgi:3-phosphoshikimate 1-carboxyvinyltransferase
MEVAGMSVVPRIVLVPGDKSLTHRALMLSVLATGESRLRGLLAGADPQSTASVLRLLGADIPAFDEKSGEIRIAGRGLRGLRAPSQTLDCGNSGTTARLMMGMLAAHEFASMLDGDESLRSRPMRRVTDPLTKMGATFIERSEPDHLPIEERGGALHGITYTSPKASAQVKSAILLAGLVGRVPVRVEEPVLSRDHTERLLNAHGASVTTDISQGGCVVISLSPADALSPLDFDVPGDFSSAAFYIAFALLSVDCEVRIPGVGINGTRIGLLPVLLRMGAEIKLQRLPDRSGEPVADLVAASSALHGTEVKPLEVPSLIDEMPILAVLAARAVGETRVTGASELRVKESDRIAAIVSNLRAVGVRAEELPDGFVVQGTKAPLSGIARTFGDHRIAMAFGVLGALPGNSIEIDDPGCVSISNPSFWSTLKAIATA